MQGNWINAAPYYGCRFPTRIALANKISHPRSVYLRQDAFDVKVNQWLATVFAPAHLTGTIDQIMCGQQAETDHAAGQTALARIEDATSKMARYRAVLDAGGDPEEIGKWIAEAEAQQLAAEAGLRQVTPGTAALSRHHIQAVIDECADITYGTPMRPT